MIIAILTILGLCFGSFVNALIWRLHKQSYFVDHRSKIDKKSKNQSTKYHLQSTDGRKYSIIFGHSMCPNCQHKLAAKDLVPIFSWLWLKGKCRYCKKPISKQYPVMELFVAMMFVISYLVWPINLDSSWQYLNFATWLVVLVGLTALAVYDIKWMILPDRIIYSLIAIIIISIIFQFALGRPAKDMTEIILSAVIGGGLFWLLYQISQGKWIGGGDVKLGFLLGLLVAKPKLAFLVLFFASIIGIIWIFPLLIAKKLTKTSKIPFGPFLIVATTIVILYGSHIIHWYQQSFILIH